MTNPMLVRGARVVLGAVTLLAAGCSVTAVTPPAPTEVPAAFREEGAWHHAASEAAVPEAWWTRFGDAQLDALERQLVIGNPNLRSVAAQLAAAQATVRASSDALWPTLSVTAGSTRSGAPGTLPGSRSTSTTDLLQLGSSWEVDLWGRYREAEKEARLGAQASADDLAAARVSAQATLAQTWFSLCAADAQAALQARTREAYERTLALTQARHDAGVVAQTDVLQARTQLQALQAQQAETALQRAQLAHAIAVLLGRAPSELALDSHPQLPEPPGVPVLLPARLLEQRPDIAAAERRVAAAYAQIGVADAAFFPDLSLSAAAGYRSNALSRLLSAPNLLWSLGPTLTASVFDSGAHRLASAQARAAAEQATATYRQTVLTALQEVEDNLVALRELGREREAQEQAWQAALRNLEITLDQYRAGTVAYLGVASAQVSALAAESTVLTLRNRQLAAVNLLLKNLGGRWPGA
jgi:NodT family efflux transporter outer membrane factor (OMF) lipoprotein